MFTANDDSEEDIEDQSSQSHLVQVHKSRTVDLQNLEHPLGADPTILLDNVCQRSICSTSSSAAPSDNEEHHTERTEVSFMVDKGRVMEGKQRATPEYTMNIKEDQLRETDNKPYSRSSTTKPTNGMQSTAYTSLESSEVSSGLRQTKQDRIAQLISGKGPNRKVSHEETVVGEEKVKPFRNISVEHKEDILTKEPQPKLYKEDLGKKTRPEKESSMRKEKKEDNKKDKERKEKLKRLERLVELHDQGMLDLGKKGHSRDGESPRMSLSERLGGISKRMDDDDTGKDTKPKLKHERLEKLMKLIEQHEDDQNYKSGRKSPSSKKSRSSINEEDKKPDDSKSEQKSRGSEESSLQSKMSSYKQNSDTNYENEEEHKSFNLASEINSKGIDKDIVPSKVEPLGVDKSNDVSSKLASLEQYATVSNTRSSGEIRKKQVDEGEKGKYTRRDAHLYSALQYSLIN